MSDRVMVMNSGRIVASFEGEAVTPEAVGGAMTRMAGRTAA